MQSGDPSCACFGYKLWLIFRSSLVFILLMPVYAVLSCLYPASVLPAGWRIPNPGRRVPKIRVRRGQRMQQRSECAGHAHGGGLWDNESCICDSGVYSCVLLPRSRAVPPALQRISQKSLFQRWCLRGHSARLQVSWDLKKKKKSFVYGESQMCCEGINK